MALDALEWFAKAAEESIEACRHMVAGSPVSAGNLLPTLQQHLDAAYEAVAVTRGGVWASRASFSDVLALRSLRSPSNKLI